MQHLIRYQGSAACSAPATTTPSCHRDEASPASGQEPLITTTAGHRLIGDRLLVVGTVAAIGDVASGSVGLLVRALHVGVKCNEMVAVVTRRSQLFGCPDCAAPVQACADPVHGGRADSWYLNPSEAAAGTRRSYIRRLHPTAKLASPVCPPPRGPSPTIDVGPIVVLHGRRPHLTDTSGPISPTGPHQWRGPTSRLVLPEITYSADCQCASLQMPNQPFVGLDSNVLRPPIPTDAR